MLRTKPLTRKVPLKGFRKKRRPGNRAMTKAESARVTEAKLGPCVPCTKWARMGRMPLSDVMQGGDYDHKKSGNLRRGHRFGYCACKWHHERHPGQGWTHKQMRDHFGPSLKDGSRLFHETYGSDDELIALQDELLGEAA